MSIARLHLITPDTSDVSVLARVRIALAGGASWVQVRTKGGADKNRLRLALDLQRECATYGATCLLNDRVDIALAVGAAGVHVGAGDLPVLVVRELLGVDAIIGATCRNADEARRAADAGASYVGAGPVYETATKSHLPPPIGPVGIESIAAAVDLPVIAIGGITVERVADVLLAGAYGVGVIGAVFDADDVGAATFAFLSALGEHVDSPTGALAGSLSGQKTRQTEVAT